MNLRRLLAVSRKEVLQLRRDRRSMVLAFLLPLLLLLLFGYAISWDVREVATAVWDADSTPQSRALLDAFWASGYFDEVARVGDAAGARAVRGAHHSTPQRRPLLAPFWASSYFDQVARVDDAAGARAVLDRSEASVVL